MATVAPPRPPAGAPAFQPYVSPTQHPAELTIRALILGAILGIVFAASSVYLALKIGLTVSASIPIAVLAVAFFRTQGRSTILGHLVGLERAVGPVATSDLFAIATFFGLGAILYRVARR
jgi:uncharacterized oligopeptide transporter (OPT) family protein